MGDSGAWNPMELLLTQWDVPVGVVLRDHRTRELEVGGGATASQGLRMFGKARFLGLATPSGVRQRCSMRLPPRTGDGRKACWR